MRAFSIFLARGFLGRVTVFVLIMVLMAVLPRLLPGDPFELLLSSDYVQEMDDAAQARLRERLGMDAGLWAQVARDLSAMARGDLGHSPLHGAPVREVLFGALPWTLLLVACATPVFLAIGVGLGIEAGRKPGSRADSILSAVMTFIAALPAFVTALLLLLIFAITLRLFPLGGAEPFFPQSDFWPRARDIAWYGALPVLALAKHEIARYFFIIRGEAVQISRRPFMMNARGRGVAGWAERYRYFGLNLLPVILARLGHSTSTLLGAVLYVEVVFSYPGIGKLMHQAVLDRDFALLQGAIAALAAITLLINWLFDVLVELLTKRG